MTEENNTHTTETPRGEQQPPVVPDFNTIKQAFEQNPTLQQQWQAEFFQSSAGATALNNHLNANKQRIEGEFTGAGYKSAMQQIEVALQELTGEEKPAGVKTTDYLKNIFAAPEKKEEGNKVDNDIAKALREENQALKAQVEKIEAEYNQKLFTNTVSSSLTQALNSINFSPNIDPSLISGEYGVANTAIKMLTASAQSASDGKTLFYKDGKPILNPQTQKPATAMEVLEIEFAKYIHKPTTGGGAPTTGGAATQGGVVDVSNLKNRDEAMTAFKRAMAAQGHSNTSKEFKQALGVFVTSKEYQKLPR